MFYAQKAWVHLTRRYRFGQARSYCSSGCKNGDKSSTSITNSSNGENAESSIGTYNKAYKQLDKLDFMTAAQILFNGPPKKKKFGIDFHLVQLFFACMPSLAVYLVAQYARYEMRRMEAELEQKKLEEEKKLKEVEEETPEEKEVDSEKVLSEVKVRLDKLEEAVKEIVVEAKKQSGDTSPAKEDAMKKEIQSLAKPSTAEAEPGKPVIKSNGGKEEGGGSASVPVKT
ncbi:hypothetical protein BT93_G1927 [Corymbia citriodora subsp. variegata]|nr:hypothetical protein BT93_G1927 [Corymbia citriodora subsp. variegata]KAF8021628.1 hypothetical protein BT93_G1927 [Corymbia citriodora subsp. variegata]